MYKYGNKKSYVTCSVQLFDFRKQLSGLGLGRAWSEVNESKRLNFHRHSFRLGERLEDIVD